MLIVTKFNMSFNGSTSSSPNLILELDAYGRLMRRTDAPNESSNHTARASRDILAQEANTMDAWTQVLENCNV